MKIRLDIDTDTNRDIEYAALVVLPLYKMYDWTWGRDVPTLTELERCIKKQVDHIVETGDIMYSSGRITSRLESDGDFHWISISLDLADIYEKDDE